MTPEELDKAVAHEAERRWRASGGNTALARSLSEVATIAACLRREGWMPPPADPDVLAFGDWYVSQDGRPGLRDAYVAGARMARKQEQEAVVALVEALRP
jgi:hypothetical protein